MAEHKAAVAEQFDDVRQEREASTLGMWVFLGTEVLFFGVLFASYTITRIDHPEAFAAASRLTHVFIGTINTAVLLTSSLTMALAVQRVQYGRSRAVAGFLLATILLGLVFLGLKGFEYYEEYQEHLVPTINFAFSGPHAGDAEIFFYLYFIMTGLHALHLTLGIVVVAVIGVMAWRGHFTARYYTPVEVTGLYWHFVDIVWIFLYPLIYLVSRS